MDTLQAKVAEKVVEVFGGGARLAGLHPLAGDASSRRYFRAVLARSLRRRRLRSSS